MEEKNLQQGYFLNGRAQIIEMLKFMNDAERTTLIRNISARNPQLAGELLEKSITFEYIKNLDEEKLILTSKYTESTIMGIALKGLDKSIQQKVLSALPREYAEKAYSILVTPLNGEEDKITRAQHKVLQTILQLKRRALL